MPTQWASPTIILRKTNLIYFFIKNCSHIHYILQIRASGTIFFSQIWRKFSAGKIIAQIKAYIEDFYKSY